MRLCYNIILLILFISLIGIVSAEDETSFNELRYSKSSEADIRVICQSSITGHYCPSSTNCSITIFEPDEVTVLISGLMTNQVAYHNFTLSKELTKNIGRYYATSDCQGSLGSDVEPFYFIIGDDNSIPLIILLIVAILFLVFGIWTADYWVAGFSGIIFTALGLYTLINGIDYLKNSTTSMISLLVALFGIYTIIKSASEYIN